MYSRIQCWLKLCDKILLNAIMHFKISFSTDKILLYKSDQINFPNLLKDKSLPQSTPAKAPHERVPVIEYTPTIHRRMDNRIELCAQEIQNLFPFDIGKRRIAGPLRGSTGVDFNSRISLLERVHSAPDIPGVIARPPG